MGMTQLTPVRSRSPQAQGASRTADDSHRDQPHSEGAGARLNVVQSPKDRAIAIFRERPDIKEADLIRESGWSRGNVRKLMGKRPAKNQGRPREAGEAPEPSTLAVEPRTRAFASRRGEPALPKTLPPRSALAASVGPNWVLGLPTLALALSLAGAGLTLSYLYAPTLASQGTIAGQILAAAMVAPDALTLILLALARELWGRGHLVWAVAAWILYPAALSGTIINASSFVATNLGDSRQGRENVTDRRSAIDAELATLRSRLATFSDRRTVEQVNADIADARRAIPVEIWNRTHGCQSVTLPDSRFACDHLGQEQASLTRAEGRARLESELAKLERDRQTLPVVSSADPGALLFSLTGFVTEQEIAVTRQAVLIACLSAVAGWLLAFADALLRRPSRSTL